MGVCTPKFLISLYLLYLGCEWLTATMSFEKLVLNTVALEFVLRIDELLYKVFFPIHYRKLVADINFFLTKGKLSVEDHWTKTMRAYTWSFAYVGLGVSTVFIYMNCMQDVLPNDMID